MYSREIIGNKTIYIFTASVACGFFTIFYIFKDRIMYFRTDSILNQARHILLSGNRQDFREYILKNLDFIEYKELDSFFLQYILNKSEYAELMAELRRYISDHRMRQRYENYHKRRKLLKFTAISSVCLIILCIIIYFFIK